MDTGGTQCMKHFLVLAVHNKMAEHHYYRSCRNLQSFSLKGGIFAVLDFNMYMLNYRMASEAAIGISWVGQPML